MRSMPFSDMSLAQSDDEDVFVLEGHPVELRTGLEMLPVVDRRVGKQMFAEHKVAYIVLS